MNLDQNPCIIVLSNSPNGIGAAKPVLQWSKCSLSADVHVLKTPMSNHVPYQTFNHIDNSFCQTVSLVVAHNPTKFQFQKFSMALPLDGHSRRYPLHGRV
jgi:hypothetical protein